MLGCLLPLALLQPSIRWQSEISAPAPRGLLALADGKILVAGHADGDVARLTCFVSEDEGKTWSQSGIIATDPQPRADLGDGNIVQSPKGTLFAVFRHNHHGSSVTKPDYAVEVAASDDGGKTWRAHSTVAISRPETKTPSRGLWSPILFITEEGTLQCYYDDEDTPFVRGFPGHQWLTMKTYSVKDRQWENPVTVARAHDPVLLSRDGMASVAEVKRNRLICAFESVQTAPPHAGMIRMVTSDDGGKTWSWSHKERETLYEPADRRFHAFSPALAKLPNNAFIALFATNEDRPEPGISGTPARDLALDIKYVMSTDGGGKWESKANLLYAGTHRNYLPGVVRLPGIQPRILASFLDFDRGCFSEAGSLTTAKQ